MLIAVERLLLKVRHAPSRSSELIELRRRLRVERARDPSADEHRLAREVQVAKHAIADQLRDVTSCGSCARGRPWPHGQYSGGDCCCGVTNDVFDDDELGALARTGTRPRDLAAPTDPHAGCAFRGARGCSLDLDHRPSRCVHYVCDSLRRELHDRARLATVEAELDELDRAMQRYASARRAGIDREVAESVAGAIADAVRR